MQPRDDVTAMAAAAPPPGVGMPDGDPLLTAEAGIRLRDDGAHDEAAALFGGLIRSFPQLVYGWQEMGVLEAGRGRDQEALALFRQAVVVDPHDFQSRKHLALHLLRLEQHAEAQATLRAHPSGNEDAIALLDEFVDYVRMFPEATALRMISAIERSPRYLTPADVEGRILAAIAAGLPLSLIRLGDGEGSWLTVSDADEARCRHLYAANRRATLNVWFGDASLYGSPCFMATQRGLVAAVARADIVGLPYGLRLAEEYRTNSIRGITACVNILRHLQACPSLNAATQFCSQDIHIDLHRREFFPKLLSMPIRFGVISCHPDLGYRLVQAHGSRVVRVLIVPEEKGFAQVVDGLSPINGVSGIAEPHFPIVYHRLRDRLRDEAAQAQVWLVAAGYLGKLYCDVVRQAGAVALDIGSLADGWCGAVTRPHLRSIADYSL